MPCFCLPPRPLQEPYLVSLIRATSWSRAGLISFTPTEELVCGLTAHYGDVPAALQLQISLNICVATLLSLPVSASPPSFYCPALKPRRFYQSYLSGERANSIRGPGFH